VALHARAVAQRLKSSGVELPPEREAALAAFLELLERWNRVYNLTAVRDPAQIVDRHFVESLALRPWLRGERIADVGTGAGLPGMPLAIAEPQRQLTLIDTRAKRIRFLRHAVAELGLTNVELVQGRAEDLRPSNPFNTVLARAVAPPAELLVICRPLTAPGSILLLLTAAHLQSAFAGLAADFEPRPLVPPSTVPLKSSIVLLERVAPADATRRVE
jgi:16S rRNA (guanine527-N7)-methyltransferase